MGLFVNVLVLLILKLPVIRIMRVEMKLLLRCSDVLLVGGTGAKEQVEALMKGVRAMPI